MILMGTLEGNGHFEDVGGDGGIILKWVLQNQDVKAWTELI